MNKNELTNPQEMVLNEDFFVLPSPPDENDGAPKLRFEITKDDSICNQWVFQINGIVFPDDLDDKETDDVTDVTVSIDYDVISPKEFAEESDRLEYSGEVETIVGGCVMTIIEEALKTDAMSLVAEDEESNESS